MPRGTEHFGKRREAWGLGTAPRAPHCLFQGLSPIARGTWCYSPIARRFRELPRTFCSALQRRWGRRRLPVLGGPLVLDTARRGMLGMRAKLCRPLGKKQTDCPQAPRRLPQRNPSTRVEPVFVQKAMMWSQKASLVIGAGILGDAWHLEHQVAGRGHGTVQEVLSKGWEWFKAGAAQSHPPARHTRGTQANGSLCLPLRKPHTSLLRTVMKRLFGDLESFRQAQGAWSRPLLWGWSGGPCLPRSWRIQ